MKIYSGNILSFLLLLLLLLNNHLYGDESSFGISFNGYIKTDIIYDSRQTVNLREGHFFLYPKNEIPDLNNNDINSCSNFNILSIQTRLLGNVKGPDAFGAKTSGLIETEFFGTAEGDMNGFRLRHGFIKFDWLETQLLVGQFWHPMFVTDCIPGVINFNTGAPFQPFSRNPQIRLTQKFSDFKILFALLTQRDFQSNGPEGFSSVYLRNAVIPNTHLQLQYQNNGFLFGLSGDYKQIKPRLVTTKNIITDAGLKTFSYIGFFKYSIDNFSIKIQGIYGENLADMLMIGGYGVNIIDTNTMTESYKPFSSTSFWGDVTYGSKIEFGLFCGYSLNNGASENFSGTIYGRATDIASLFRISPRISINSGQSRISTEFDITTAEYGKNNVDNKGRVENTKKISNIRMLVAFYYLF